MNTPKIHAAMIAIMRDITAIGKDSKNQAQGFKFRGIDACYNELHNLLAKHGVVTLPQAGTPIVEERTNTKGTTLRFVQIPMTYQFVAEDGSSITCQVIGEGMDSGDKATNKAMAIAHKYALLQTFLIPTEEQKDPDYETHEVAPRKPAIGKPAFKKADPTIGASKIPENSAEFLLSMMDSNGVPEGAVFEFLADKGMDIKASRVSDIPEAILNRLIDSFDKVIAFNSAK
jgi:hypothetical protein